jgi:hypothetical protein
MALIMAVVGLRPVFTWFHTRTGHGELLILLGFVLAVGVGVGRVERAHEFLPDVSVVAIARYPDQVAELEVADVDLARDLHEDPRAGLRRPRDLDRN